MVRCLSGVLASLLIVLAGCTANDQPRVEICANGVCEPVDHTGYEMTGKRDGSTTRAVATFVLADGARLEIELDVVYNPTPALGEGRWRLDGGSTASGDVHAEALKFLGGQGQYASVGGRFRLEEDGVPRFRVVLPARPVVQANWGSQ